MLKQIKENAFFFLPYFIILILTSIIMLVFDKSFIHIRLNQFHNDFSDLFFKIITNFGDGLFVIPVYLLLLLFSFRKALFFSATFLSSGLFVQILKRFIFDEIVRPVKYFEGIYDLYFVEGVKIHSYFTFPSGHSATTFGFFLCLALISKSKIVKILSLFFACLVGYSRIYISQHFLVDVYAGSIIGIFGAVSFYNIIYLSGKNWLDNSILILTGKKSEHKRK